MWPRNSVSSLLDENEGGCLDTDLVAVFRAGLASECSCGHHGLQHTVTVKPNSSFLRKRTKTGMKCLLKVTNWLEQGLKHAALNVASLVRDLHKSESG